MHGFIVPFRRYIQVLITRLIIICYYNSKIDHTCPVCLSVTEMLIASYIHADDAVA